MEKKSGCLLRIAGRLAALWLLAGLIAACGAGGARPAAPAAAPAGAVGAAPAVDRASASQAAPAPASAGKTAGGASGSSALPSGGPAAALGVPSGIDPSVAFDRKIVLNADISLRVENAKQALQDLKDIANFSRGYISDANLTGSDSDGWTLKLVMRIPAGNYGDALDRIHKLGEVRAERQWSQDVTEQYIDLNARLTTLQEYEQRLRELAAKASSFDEWLKLTQQVNDTRTQIESLTGRLRVLNNQVELSTINLSVTQPPAAAKPEEPKPASLLGRIAGAFKDSAHAMRVIGEGLLVFLAGFLPVGVVLGLVVLVVWYGVRRWRQYRAHAAPQAPPPATGNSGD